MSKNKTKLLLDEVRAFIIGSQDPVTFGELFVHVKDKLPVGTYRPADVKLAAYRMIDSGEATFTREWTIAPKQKEEHAGAREETADAAAAPA